MLKVHEFTIVFIEPDYMDETNYIIGRIHDFLEEQEFTESLSVGSSDDGSITVYIGADKKVPVEDIRRKVIESLPESNIRPDGILRLV